MCRLSLRYVYLVYPFTTEHVHGTVFIFTENNVGNVSFDATVKTYTLHHYNQLCYIFVFIIIATSSKNIVICWTHE